MKYLEIKSKGEVDEGAFTLIGATTKRGDSTKIGLWGSGNKYSIAALIRNNISFKVFSGNNEIKFTTKTSSFRGQDFEVIQVNGRDTSLTTNMGGADWDSPFAPIREIYSNALDEDDDASINVTSKFNPEKGVTKVYIHLNEDVKHFYENVHLYFCGKGDNVLHSNPEGTIYKNSPGGVRIFRKGILAHHDKEKLSVFNYNSEDIEINESRVIKNMSSVNTSVARILKTCNNTDIILQLLLELNGSNCSRLEHSVYWDSYKNFSPAWYEVLKDKKLIPIEYREMFDANEMANGYLLPIDLLKPLKQQFDGLNILGLSSTKQEVLVNSSPSQILVNKVLDAISILNNTEYKYRLSSPKIEYVKFEDASILGLAEDGVIYLSTKLDVRSVDEIAKIIIEENEHNITGYSDQTRTFQNHLFNLYYEELIKK